MSVVTEVADTRLVIRRTYAAPVEKVYRAWTDPTQMSRWLSANPRWKSPTIDADLRVGGRHNIKMNHTDGDSFNNVGQYLEVVPNEKISFTWTWLESPFGREETVVTVEFRAVAAGTELTLIHDRVTDPAVRESLQSGWVGCLEMLEAYLGGNDPLAI